MLESKEMQAIFRGDVQGVGFRYTAYTFAKQLGITGTVRNMPDGTVELIAQGSQDNLKSLVTKLQEYFALDPQKSIFITFSEPQQSFNDFFIIH